MPSSTSNFKRILRLPRLFFRKPTPEESVHGGPPLEFERPVPRLPWRGMTVVVVLIVLAAATTWEIYVRSIGYAPTLNDNEDLWTLRRRSVTLPICSQVFNAILYEAAFIKPNQLQPLCIAPR